MLAADSLVVNKNVQPAILVEWSMLEGNTIYIGSTASFQIELTDLDGNPFDPEGRIFISVYLVTAGTVADTAAITGSALQVELEGVLQPGQYYFEFDTTPLSGAQALIRASIPYENSAVVDQLTLQLKALTDIS